MYHLCAKESHTVSHICTVANGLTQHPVNITIRYYVDAHSGSRSMYKRRYSVLAKTKSEVKEVCKRVAHITMPFLYRVLMTR